MPFATSGNARIRTNIPAENAYNALDVTNRGISLAQLRLSTGKRINNASDDVAGYITARALQARNGALRSALNSVGDALNVTNILQDALDNINQLMIKIKDSAATASSGAMGTDEKVALAKAGYRLTQQIQSVADSTVFGGQQMLSSLFTADFFIATDASHNLLTLSIDMRFDNPDYDIPSRKFDINSLETGNFAGVEGLNLTDLADINLTDLGIFSVDQIGTTLTSMAKAMNNVNKVATYLGGIDNRLQSQEDLLKSQITNYNAAISRFEDADVAKEQLELIRQQFLQQTSLLSLSQANQNPNSYLQLIRG